MVSDTWDRGLLRHSLTGIRSLAFAHWHLLTGSQVQRVLYSALDEAPVEELVKSIEQVWYCMQLLILNRMHDLLMFRRI